MLKSTKYSEMIIFQPNIPLEIAIIVWNTSQTMCLNKLKVTFHLKTIIIVAVFSRM